MNDAVPMIAVPMIEVSLEQVARLSGRIADKLADIRKQHREMEAECDRLCAADRSAKELLYKECDAIVLPGGELMLFRNHGRFENIERNPTLGDPNKLVEVPAEWFPEEACHDGVHVYGAFKVKCRCGAESRTPMW